MTTPLSLFHKLACTTLLTHNPFYFTENHKRRITLKRKNNETRQTLA